MTVARVAKLDKLGFAWELLVGVERSRAERSVRDKDLGSWVRSQRQRKNTMPKERDAKLRSLGFF